MRISDWSSDVCSSDLAGGVGLALGLYGGEEIVDGFLLPPLPAHQVGAVRLQAEDVGRFRDPAEVEKFLYALFAQPLYVERGAADEMAQPFEPLGGADEAEIGRAHV